MRRSYSIILTVVLVGYANELKEDEDLDLEEAGPEITLPLAVSTFSVRVRHFSTSRKLIKIK